MALTPADKKANKFVAKGGFTRAQEQKIVNAANSGATGPFNARSWAVVRKYEGTPGPQVTGQTAAQSAAVSGADLMADAIDTGIDPTLNSQENLANQARLNYLRNQAQGQYDNIQGRIDAQGAMDRANAVKMASDYGRQRQGRAVAALSSGMAGNPALANEIEMSDAYAEDKAAASAAAQAKLNQLIYMRDHAFDDYNNQALMDPTQTRIDQDVTVANMVGRGVGTRLTAPPLVPEPAAPSLPVVRAQGKNSLWRAANSLSAAETKAQYGMTKAQMVNQARKVANARGVTPAKALDIVRAKAKGKK